MSGTRRKALLVSAALVGGTLLLTACGDSDKAAGAGAAKDAVATAPAGNAAGATPNGSTAENAAKGSEEGADKGSSGQVADKGTGNGGDKGGASGQGKGPDGSGVDRGDGVRVPVQQSCGANDISWSTRAETQAGGYILIMAKAKPGITCVLPNKYPVVAFGSDGTEASPAEHAVGKSITLSGNKTAYAGVNPKTTNTDYYKELHSIIVAPEQGDSDPAELKTGPIRVDKPIVTNWHTSAKDAVPFN
ncbi:DUF4232 domain-containing protein [Streptomyces tsukubensis]|uniref:DUF4232 domain-containing protein n=1 Tax=Streptomyces tsukubensis TaxID=83656 RepID=UPI00344E6856